ncbi:MAG: 5-histidylcysteine sulfoxide synthase [Campylobacterota bacterium]|nr:5-histidylcysteine sulfoxide synthase [Campylobacterota bacterium]
MLPITLTGTNEEQKRQEILKYFLDGYELFEKLFDMLKDDSVFYKKSEPTRHPMIFYFGHTATFFINKLILAKVIDTRINPNFESIFAIGVDEMSWDDLDESRYNWPKVDDIRQYRDEVKKLVSDLIMTLPISLPIKQNDPMWIILMGCEHERIHIETSSVLHRQMPIEFIKKIDGFPICQDDTAIIQNELIKIDTRDIRLGINGDYHLYAWDNEYGIYNSKVQQFKTSKYLVSNYEFIQFVEDDGYEKEEFWDKEGQKFLETNKAKHPTFWIKDNGGKYYYRTLMEIIPIPLSWPVEVNALEAYAYCRWRSKKENISYTLPSEEQYYSMIEQADIKDIPNFDDKKTNINLSHYASACPVDRFEFNGIYDAVGNVWQWCRTPIYPFDGFKVHPIYDDFSVPTFDSKHNLLNGGSFISTGNEMMKHSRYAFRRHIYQHAGFRYVTGDQYLDIKNSKTKDKFIEKELEKHTNDDKIIKRYRYIKTLIGDYKLNNILEIGCSIGSGSVELSTLNTHITAVDTTARIIQEAKKHIKVIKDITNIKFWQADPCNLKPNLKDYDLIIVNDILDRVYSPVLLLQELKNRVNKGGIIVTVTNNSDDIRLLKKSFTFQNSSVIENKQITLWEKI